MTVQSGIERELPFLRAEAAARMTSTCTIRRRTGERDTDPSGIDVEVWATVYTGPVRIAGAARGASPVTGRDNRAVEVNHAHRDASLPLGTAVADGDLIEITAGDTTGLVFRIVEAAGKDQATALRVPVEAVERPPEWS